jgi:GNAT superfamily N-acetyltransferase
MSSVSLHPELDTTAKKLLADALADAPEHCLAVHFLRRDLCRAWAAGDPAAPSAVLIQPAPAPDELLAFGSSPECIAYLLGQARDWDSVAVGSHLGDRLGGLLELRSGHAVRSYADRCCISRVPLIARPHPYVRLLTAVDRMLLECLSEARAGACWGGTDVLLRDGFAAGAVVSGCLVAAAFTRARTDRYAGIHSYTMPGWRRRGIATAAVACAAAAAADRGLTPVWSFPADDVPPLKIAGALGFTEHARVMHLIPVRSA